MLARVRPFALLAGLAVFVSGGFTKDRPAEATKEHEIKVAGQTRSYLLHLPKDKGKEPVPLVFVLHGLGATGKITEAMTGLSELADKHGFAACYPDGQKKMWKYWGDEDADFLKALIDELVKNGTADPKRIYFTGISNGAYMSARLACDMPDRIAAIAPVAGTMPKIKAERTKLARPVPMLYFHGTEDAVVGFTGKDAITKREMSLGAEDFVKWWAKHNECEEKPESKKLEDTAKDDCTVEKFTYKPKKGGAEVVFCKIEGGGHTWPGGSVQPEKILAKTCRDINASEMIWEFFAKHKLPDK